MLSYAGLVIVRLVALALRLGALALSGMGLCQLVARREDQRSPSGVTTGGAAKAVTTHNRSTRLVFGGIGCLFLSRALGAWEPVVVVELALVFVVLCLIQRLWERHVAIDPLLLLPIVFLLAVGAAVSCDTTVDATRSLSLLGLQLSIYTQPLFIVIGCVTCMLTMTFLTSGEQRVNRLSSLVVPLFILAGVLCLCTRIPGLSSPTLDANGNISDFTRIHFGPLQIQTPEFAKVLVIIALAGYLSANEGEIARMTGRGYVPLVAAVLLVLFFELITHDLGSTVVTFCIVVGMLLFCNDSDGSPYKVVVAVATVLFAMLALMVALHLSSTFARRFADWQSGFAALPWVAPSFSDTQQIHGGNVIGGGGLLGTGLGFGGLRGYGGFQSILHSSSDYERYVYAIESDYAIAAVTLEIGLVGAFEVLLAYGIFVWRTVRASRAFRRGAFRANVLVGTACAVILQALVILGGCLGLIPFTGVTLPFVSCGGSSIFALLLLLGVCGGSLAVRDPRLTPGQEDHGGSLAAVRVQGDATRRPKGLSLVAEVLLVGSLALCGVRLCAFQPSLRLCGWTCRELGLDVTDSDGRVLATYTVDQGGVGGKTQVSYPNGTLAAHLLTSYEAGGLVSLSQVRGEAAMGFGNAALNLLGLSETLPDVQLTIRSEVQDQAETKLDGMTGAVVALDVHTGAVLAEASSPTFDANDRFETGLDESALENRAVGVAYAPGSTFKLVTMAAAIENGIAGPSTPYDADTLVIPGEGTVTNHLGAEYGTITLTQALEYSSNAAFGRLGLNVGASNLATAAESFGFNHFAGDDETPSGVPGSVKSTFVTPPTDLTLAWAADGQPDNGGVGSGPKATVLQMCTVIATIAGEGVRANPYLVATSPVSTVAGGAVGPQGSAQVLTSAQADALWGMAAASGAAASEGYGVSQGGLDMIGKTGSAEWGDGVRCWYVCATRDVAVACCIEGGAGDLGGQVAQPIAVDVLKAAS